MPVLIIVAAAMFFIPILGVAFGALSGWLVSLFFNDTILQTLAAFGINTQGLELWQIGATLGFVGSFFKSATVSNSN